MIAGTNRPFRDVCALKGRFVFGVLSGVLVPPGALPRW